jgi:hypothetical protein
LGDVNWLHVGVAAAGGALGGGFGSAIYDLSTNLAFNIAANAAVGSAISAASTAYQNCVGGESESIGKSAIIGGVFGAAGGFLGAGIANAAEIAAARAQASFNNFVSTLMGGSSLYANSGPGAVQSAISGVGGFVGNVAGNTASNAAPTVFGP